MKTLIPVAMDLIVPLLFLSKDGFGIKEPMKVGVSLNKYNQIKPNISSFKT